ncbi:MAG TPA: PfkB family carbohydrate kinase [Anaeromyxobacter sp.]
MAGPTTVVVCGHVTRDHLADGICAGGSAYYAGRALAGLGARPRILTAAGADFPRDALAGIEADVAPAAATTSFVNAYAADGTRTQRVLAAAPPLDPARLPAAWRSPDVLLLAPVLGEVDVPRFAAAAAARLVGLCVQGLVREVGPDGAVHPRPLPLDDAALALVGAAVVGEDEARGTPDLVRRLAAAVPVVAFTQGERGCDVLVRGRARRVGIHPARVVDPTGAGDVFAAAFLLGLARGEDPLDAARLGAAAASVAVEGRAGESLGRIGEAFARAARVPILP